MEKRKEGEGEGRGEKGQNMEHAMKYGTSYIGTLEKSHSYLHSLLFIIYIYIDMRERKHKKGKRLEKKKFLLCNQNRLIPRCGKVPSYGAPWAVVETGRQAAHRHISKGSCQLQGKGQA